MLFVAKLFSFRHQGTKALRKTFKYFLCVLVTLWQISFESGLSSLGYRHILVYFILADVSSIHIPLDLLVFHILVENMLTQGFLYKF